MHNIVICTIIIYYSFNIDILSVHAQLHPTLQSSCTAVNSFNTSISLNWIHDRTCFESVLVEYQVLVRVNTANQFIITNRLMVEIDGVISGTTYTISVMAVDDGTQRSEVDSMSITAGGYSC